MSTAKSPFLIGLRAAKANLLPGLVIQAAMVSIVVAYYTVPRVHDWLCVLAEIKRNGGLPFSAVSAVVAGAIFPEVLAITIFQKGRITRKNLGNLLFNAALWGFEGVVVDLFYRTQAVIFGDHADFATVFKKVLVDQLVYTTFFATPFSVGCFEWKNQGYSTKGMSRVFTPGFYKNQSVPALIASWGVWIPLVSVIYSLPSLLQFPIFTLGLTFWVMMLTYVTSAEKKKSALPFSPPVGNAAPIQS
ncbi:MAG TPA: hypothetical protein VG733_10910 [Chthoniobacteraceae bacterium]|nr:hypothetical protein [Chthoniobacteraceae bacterium]